MDSSKTLVLTKTQAHLLYIQAYCEYPETWAEHNNTPEAKQLRAELQTGAGRKVTVTRHLLAELENWADLDADYAEQAVAKRALAAARVIARREAI